MKPLSAKLRDIPHWLRLAAEVEYLFGPMENDTAFREALHGAVGRGEALCIRENDSTPEAGLIGGIVVSREQNSIEWFAVTAQYRRHGAGRTLLAAALDMLDRGRPVTVQTFDATASEGTAARTLYAHFGFTDRAPGAPTPAGIHTVIMERPAQQTP